MGDITDSLALVDINTKDQSELAISRDELYGGVQQSNFTAKNFLAEHNTDLLVKECNASGSATPEKQPHDENEDDVHYYDDDHRSDDQSSLDSGNEDSALDFTACIADDCGYYGHCDY